MIKKYQQNKLVTLLAMEANHTDKALAKDNYYALIRVIVKELVRNKKIILPDFGTFSAKMRKPSKGRNIRTGELDIVAPVRTVRFKPCDKLKFYFKNISIKENRENE